MRGINNFDKTDGYSESDAMSEMNSSIADEITVTSSLLDSRIQKDYAESIPPAMPRLILGKRALKMAKKLTKQKVQKSQRSHVTEEDDENTLSMKENSNQHLHIKETYGDNWCHQENGLFKRAHEDTQTVSRKKNISFQKSQFINAIIADEDFCFQDKSIPECDYVWKDPIPEPDLEQVSEYALPKHETPVTKRMCNDKENIPYSSGLSWESVFDGTDELNFFKNEVSKGSEDCQQFTRKRTTFKSSESFDETKKVSRVSRQSDLSPEHAMRSITNEANFKKYSRNDMEKLVPKKPVRINEAEKMSSIVTLGKEVQRILFLGDEMDCATNEQAESRSLDGNGSQVQTNSLSTPAEKHFIKDFSESGTPKRANKGRSRVQGIVTFSSIEEVKSFIKENNDDFQHFDNEMTEDEDQTSWAIDTLFKIHSTNSEQEKDDMKKTNFVTDVDKNESSIYEGKVKDLYTEGASLATSGAKVNAVTTDSPTDRIIESRKRMALDQKKIKISNLNPMGTILVIPQNDKERNNSGNTLICNELREIDTSRYSQDLIKRIEKIASEVIEGKCTAAETRPKLDSDGVQLLALDPNESNLSSLGTEVRYSDQLDDIHLSHFDPDLSHISHLGMEVKYQSPEKRDGESTARLIFLSSENKTSNDVLFLSKDIGYGAGLNGSKSSRSHASAQKIGDDESDIFAFDDYIEENKNSIRTPKKYVSILENRNLNISGISGLSFNTLQPSGKVVIDKASETRSIYTESSKDTSLVCTPSKEEISFEDIEGKKVEDASESPSNNSHKSDGILSSTTYEKSFSSAESSMDFTAMYTPNEKPEKDVLSETPQSAYCYDELKSFDESTIISDRKSPQSRDDKQESALINQSNVSSVGLTNSPSHELTDLSSFPEEAGLINSPSHELTDLSSFSEDADILPLIMEKKKDLDFLDHLVHSIADSLLPDSSDSKSVPEDEKPFDEIQKNSARQKLHGSDGFLQLEDKDMSFSRCSSEKDLLPTIDQKLHGGTCRNLSSICQYNSQLNIDSSKGRAPLSSKTTPNPIEQSLASSSLQESFRTTNSLDEKVSDTKTKNSQKNRVKSSHHISDFSPDAPPFIEQTKLKSSHLKQEQEKTSSKLNAMLDNSRYLEKDSSQVYGNVKKIQCDEEKTGMSHGSNENQKGKKLEKSKNTRQDSGDTGISETLWRSRKSRRQQRYNPNKSQRNFEMKPTTLQEFSALESKSLYRSNNKNEDESKTPKSYASPCGLTSQTIENRISDRGDTNAAVLDTPKISNSTSNKDVGDIVIRALPDYHDIKSKTVGSGSLRNQITMETPRVSKTSSSWNRIKFATKDASSDKHIKDANPMDSLSSKSDDVLQTPNTIKLIKTPHGHVKSTMVTPVSGTKSNLLSESTSPNDVTSFPSFVASPVEKSNNVRKSSFSSKIPESKSIESAKKNARHNEVKTTLDKTTISPLENSDLGSKTRSSKKRVVGSEIARKIAALQMKIEGIE